jgi:hypothetical protein
MNAFKYSAGPPERKSLDGGEAIRAKAQATSKQPFGLKNTPADHLRQLSPLAAVRFALASRRVR